MILAEGDKVLIVHRRLFELDAARFFIGTVEAYEDGVARVTGHSWVKDQLAGGMIERQGRRTKLLALASGTLIVYRLPDDVDPLSLHFEAPKEGGLWLADGGKLRMDLREK